VAEGAGGFRVYDVANVGNKGVSQRIITAPFSANGHDSHVPSKNATCMAIPTNQSIAPGRNQGDLMRITNEEQPFHPIYSYAFITDSVEGLIVTDVDTFSDGEPRNNFLTRATTWNPDGVLNGARHITIGGHYAYVTTPKGVVFIDIDDPRKPKLISVIDLPDARATALQFRYLFVTDATGLRVIDVSLPKEPRLTAAKVALADAHKLYLARTMAYVAGGKDGLAIVDIERPTSPFLYMKFNADGKMNDTRDVIVGTTNASLFAYVADGVNGLKVVQLTAPDTQPKFYGFSPDPKPVLVSWRKTSSPAIAMSKGLDRDRAVDETGGQIAIFGRIGSRPFSGGEMEKLYMRPDGRIWTVTDEIRMSDFVPRKPKSSIVLRNAGQ